MPLPKKTVSRVIVLLTLLILAADCSKTEPENQTLQEETINKSRESSNSDDTSLFPLEHKVTFIELGSVNCIPCIKMQPIMKEIEQEFGDQVKVIFHDVWTPEGKPYAEQYAIRVIPTQVFLDCERNEYFRHEGFFPKEEVVKVLRQKGVR